MDIAARVLGVGNAFEERIARYSPPPDLRADDSSYEFLRTTAAAVLGAAQDAPVDERGIAFGPAVAEWTRAFEAGARAFADAYPRVLSERVF